MPIRHASFPDLWKILIVADVEPDCGTAEAVSQGHAAFAVLPFANQSGDPEQEYFADDMVEEIVTPPSRGRWLFAG